MPFGKYVRKNIELAEVSKSETTREMGQKMNLSFA